MTRHLVIALKIQIVFINHTWINAAWTRKVLKHFFFHNFLPRISYQIVIKSYAWLSSIYSNITDRPEKPLSIDLISNVQRVSFILSLKKLLFARKFENDPRIRKDFFLKKNVTEKTYSKVNQFFWYSPRVCSKRFRGTTHNVL